MQIVLTAQVVFNEWLPGPTKPGRGFLFSDNLRWQSIDATTVAASAGTHSGTRRFLRSADDNDGVLVKDVHVVEYEATFVLEALTHDGLQLDAGQVTARGVWYMRNDHPVDAQGQQVNEKRYAVTGGTGAYRHVRGQGFESVD